MPADIVNISYRHSDPCLLDRVKRDDSEKVEKEEDLVSKFRSSESSVQEVSNKQYPELSEVHSRSVDSWLTDHLQEELVKHKLFSDIKHNQITMENVKHNSKNLIKDEIISDKKRKEKKWVNGVFE